MQDMYEGLTKGIFSPKPTPAPVPAVKPVFDDTKYLTPFLTNDAIKQMADQVSAVDIPRSPWPISLIFMGIKIAALSTLYGLWSKNKENEMKIDKFRFNSTLSQQLDQDNEVV